MLELFFFVVLFGGELNPVVWGTFPSHGECMKMRAKALVETATIMENDPYHVTTCLSMTFTVTGRPSDMKP